uniref:Secreted protein n=1 Tax=Kalanchoe fedtschenkoi TaxID=63787 RepID=A0A7N0ZQE7_KALFE
MLCFMSEHYINLRLLLLLSISPSLPPTLSASRSPALGTIPPSPIPPLCLSSRFNALTSQTEKTRDSSVEKNRAVPCGAVTEI